MCRTVQISRLVFPNQQTSQNQQKRNNSRFYTKKRVHGTCQARVSAPQENLRHHLLVLPHPSGHLSHSRSPRLALRRSFRLRSRHPHLAHRSCRCNPIRVGSLSVDGLENLALDPTFLLDSALDNADEPTLLASEDAVETV